MATRERRLLEQIIKSWAQDHDAGHIIADYNTTDEALKSTQGFFTWVIKEGIASVDLESLVDRIQFYLDNRRSRKYKDGMYCKKCQDFYEFAEPNQEDGSMVCYGCRTSPYA